MLKLIEAEEKYLDQYQKAYEESLDKINSGKMKKPLERTKTGGRVKNCRKKIAD